MIDFKPESGASTGKLQKVLADLKVASLLISEDLRKTLVQVFSNSRDAFAASATYLGRTSVVLNRIKMTADAKPVRHQLRAIPYVRRQFLEQDVEKLLAINAVAPANPGECPYASRTVVANTKDGTLRMVWTTETLTRRPKRTRTLCSGSTKCGQCCPNRVS